jgi:hypothetical protein
MTLSRQWSGSCPRPIVDGGLARPSRQRQEPPPSEEDDGAQRRGRDQSSEVAHQWDGDVCVLGGGLTWLFASDEWAPRCVVGSSFDEARERVMTMRLKGVVDYFGVCTGLTPPPRIGDTAVFPLLLPQIFMNRAYVAVVSGISRGEPRLEGLFDSATNELDADFSPISAVETRANAERVARSYLRTAHQA